MKLPLISLSLMLIGACAPYTEITSTRLSDGRNAIVLDDAPLSIDRHASELCPFGYQVLSDHPYQNFPRIYHEQMVIVCNPLPKDFPQ